MYTNIYQIGINKMKPIDQLKYLKVLTITTGAIHEAQVSQLKIYPYIIPNIQNATISIDIKNKSVQYELFFKNNKKPRKTQKVKKAMDTIKQWTQYLLWDDANVVFKNG